MTKRQRYLINKLLVLNPTLIIAGSIALEMQGFDLRRKVRDLDLVLPYQGSKPFKTIPGMIAIDEEGSQKRDDGFKVLYYKYKDTNIEVFEYEKGALENIKSITRPFGIGYIKLTHFSEIIKFKSQIALTQDSIKAIKHRLDIIYLLTQAFEIVFDSEEHTYKKKLSDDNDDLPF